MSLIALRPRVSFAHVLVGRDLFFFESPSIDPESFDNAVRSIALEESFNANSMSVV